MFQTKDDRDLVAQLLRLGVLALPGFILIYNELGPKTLELDGILFFTLGVVISGLLYLAYQFGALFAVMVLNAFVPKDKFLRDEVRVFDVNDSDNSKKGRDLSYRILSFYMPGGILTFLTIVLVNGGAPADSFIENVKFCAYAGAGFGFMLAFIAFTFWSELFKY